MAFDFSRGSEWRRWDLHLHTASSYDYRYKGSDSDDILIGALHSNGIAAVAITDHFVIDANRILNLRQLAPDIVFFPGVELRTDKGDTNIHIILIFDCETDLAVLAEDFRVFKREKAKGIESDESIYWDFNDITSFAKQHDALISVHAGQKSNGMDRQITNALEHNQAVKNEYDKYVHIYEMGKIADFDDYRAKVFPSLNRIKPMIICSDNHDPRSYETKAPLWIKADLTFQGLKQIIFEPDERVRVQEESPEYEYDKTAFGSVVFEEDTPCFANSDEGINFKKSIIPLNTGLVSIIGGRGAGKSMLVSFVGAGLGKSRETAFNSKASTVVIGYKRSITEGERLYRLSDAPLIPYMYISQGQVARLINDREAFNENIRETIGISQPYAVPSEVRDIAERCINQFYSSVKIINEGGTTYAQKEQELKKNIEKNKAFIESVTSEANKKRLEDYTRKITAREKLSAIRNRINGLKTNIIESIDAVNKNIQLINEQLFSRNADYIIPLVSYVESVKKIDGTIMKALESKDREHALAIEEIRAQFKDYKGDISTLLSSVQGYKDQELANERELLVLKEENRKLEVLAKEGFKKVGEKICESLREYKKAVEDQWVRFKAGVGSDVQVRQKLVKKILDENQLNVRVQLGVDLMAFVDELYNEHKLDGRKYRKDKILDILKIHSIDDYFDFICQKNDWNVFSAEIENDLRSRLLEVLFKKFPAFIRHDIVVEANGRPLNKLSHGQQGTVYLRLQIAANLFSETIVYDQPEDDLDNQFITQELIDLFRTIKKYRQVIIVSHNANLVVNSDSEQIIVAKNEGGMLSYESGSLEDPIIQKKVCDILEGGRDAFNRRWQRYRVSR